MARSHRSEDQLDRRLRFLDPCTFAQVRWAVQNVKEPRLEPLPGRPAARSSAPFRVSSPCEGRGTLATREETASVLPRFLRQSQVPAPPRGRRPVIDGEPVCAVGRFLLRLHRLGSSRRTRVLPPPTLIRDPRLAGPAPTPDEQSPKFRRTLPLRRRSGDHAARSRC